MQIGRLRHRIALERFTETGRDVHGGVTGTWARFARRWAEIEPLSGTEGVFSDKLSGVATHKITLRGDVVVSRMDRILFGTRYFHVVDFQYVDERTKELLLSCRESL